MAPSRTDLTERSDATGQTIGRWAFRIGVGCFVVGLVSPVFVPLVAATDLPTQWKTVLSGLLVLGFPELLWIVAVAVMGKAGFDVIKRRAFGLLKEHALPDTVSRTRYRIGLVLFVLPILFGWLVPYAPDLVPGYEKHRLAVNLAGDLLLLTSLFVLGGQFWDKVRALFVHDAKVRFPA